jgi:hypothetical protein
MASIKSVTTFAKTTTATTTLFTRYLVLTKDGGMYVSNAALSTTKAATLLAGSAFDPTSSDFTPLNMGIGSVAGFALYDNVLATTANKKVQLFLYTSEGKAWSFDLPYVTTQPIALNIYLGYTTATTGSGATASTTYTFFSQIDQNGNLPTTSFSLNSTTAAIAAPTITSTSVGTVGSMMNSVALNAPADGSLGFDRLFKFNDKLFLFNFDSNTTTSTQITSANAIFLGLDKDTLKAVTDRLFPPTGTGSTPPPAPGLYLVKDQQQNYHLIVTNDDAPGAMAVKPLDLVIAPSGQLLASNPLSYAALNYLLEGKLGINYDLSGQSWTDSGAAIAFNSAANSVSYGDVTIKNPGGDASLKIFKVTGSKLDPTDANATADLGWVLSTASTNAQAKVDNSYYLGTSVGLDDLTTDAPSVFVKNKSLLLVWNNNTSSAPLYLTAAQGAPVSTIDRLTTDKLLSLEKAYAVDLNNDGISDGTIAYTSLSIQPTGSTAAFRLYKTSNGEFFTFSPSAPPSPLANSGTIGLADLKDKLLPVSASLLRSYETGTGTDLNGDGLIGAVVESTMLVNENFSIYKTTAGDLVYSLQPGLLSGDLISDAIGVAMSAQDQKLFESAKMVVARVVDGKLYMASQSQDPLTGLTVLHETTYSVSANLGAQSYSLLTTADFSYNNTTASRKDFLVKEKDYNVDLNNDGVIGDAIVDELAANAQATVYQTASGAIYISTNNGLTTGDVVDAGAFKLYDLENAPYRIDAAIYRGTNIQVYRTDPDSTGKLGYYTQSIAIASNVYSTPVKLTDEELVQTEVNYGIDINGDGHFGGLVGSIAFGNSSSSYPAQTAQDAGLYTLKLKADSSAPLQVMIAATGAAAKVGDIQASSGVYFLKSSQGIASGYWQLPVYGQNRTTVVVGEGIFANNSANAVDIVFKDTPTGGGSAGSNYYLVSFDANGNTTKPKGSLLSAFGLYNEEIKLGTDLTRDGKVGDTITSIATSDSFGLYKLDHSGAIVLSTDGTWGSGSVQKGGSFLQLKNANGSTWLPYGFTLSAGAGGVYGLSQASDAAKITQVTFNADGTADVYLMRQLQGATGVSSSIYDVKFNAAGITKNPTGSVVTQTDLYATELSKGLDINGDGVVGKPFVSFAYAMGNSGGAWFSLFGDKLNPNIYTSCVKVFNAATGKDLIVYSASYGANIQFNLSADTNSASNLSANNSVTIVTPDFQTSIYDFAVIGSRYTSQPYVVGVSSGDTNTGGNYVFSYGSQNNYQHSLFSTRMFADRIGGTGDFNGDGNGDFVVYGGQSIQLFKGDGHGSFKSLQTILPNSTIPTSFYGSLSQVIVCDLNGDKKSDLAVIGESGNGEIFTSFANVDGRLLQKESVVLEHSWNGHYGAYVDLVAGDLNNDKKDDIVIIGNSDNSLIVVLGTAQGYCSNGVFNNATYLNGIYAPIQARIGDINLDGKADIVVLDRDASGRLQVDAFFGKGDGSFFDAQTVITNADLSRSSFNDLNQPDAGYTSLNIGDFNGDGSADLLVTASQTQAVYYNATNCVTAGGKMTVSVPRSGSIGRAMLDFTDFNHYLINQKLEKTVVKTVDGTVLYDAFTNTALNPSVSPDIKITGLPDISSSFTVIH